MRATVKKMNSSDNKRIISNKIALIFQDMADELVMDLIMASKKKLELTLYGTTPRGTRAEYKQKGFEKAQVSILQSKVTRTNYGAKVTVQVAVTDGASSNPHYVWHLINKGFQSGVSSQVRRFPVRANKRTKVGDLKTGAFGGYTGEWRSIKAGERPAPVAPRHWYKTALNEIEKETISKYGMLFTFNKKEANDG